MSFVGIMFFLICVYDPEYVMFFVLTEQRQIQKGGTFHPIFQEWICLEGK